MAGTITILQRESKATNNAFAGSGGVVDQSNVSDSTTALTGGFSLTNSKFVEVTGLEPGSLGSASASANLVFDDSVSQSAPGLLGVTAVRDSSANASYGTGSASSNYSQVTETRVRFTVNGDNANYTLLGSLAPDAEADILQIQLYRPFTANVLFDLDAPDAVVNESGILTAGLTYELRLRITDARNATSSIPSVTSDSAYNFQFNVVSIPEPTLAALVVAVPLVTRRRLAR